MAQIVNIMAMGGTGATFLDWTINYLAQEELYNWHTSKSSSQCNQMVDAHTQLIKSTIPEYPLNVDKKTAHGHKTTLIDTSQIGKMLALVNSGNIDGLFTMYSVFGEKSFTNRKSTNYGEIISQYPEIKFNVIFNFNVNDIDSVYLWKIDRERAVEGVRELQLPTWVRREILALRYHKTVFEQIMNEDCSQYPRTILLNFNDYITRFDSVIRTFMDELELDIIESRMHNWKCIYEEWQRIVDIHFIENIESIVNDIVNAKSHDLTQYDMTLGKEIVLSKRLLYNHNLSLKSYGLETMPNNTSDWHNLLEVNTYHDLSI